jgi:CDGSH-type Zn-finger protein
MDEPTIRVTRDGPYVVEGDVEFVATSQVETEFGEPVDWAPAVPLAETANGATLCRCGRSGSKPFCDDSHVGSGFDGTETAPREGYAERARVFHGHDLELRDDRPTLCEHAGYCADRFTSVWGMLLRSADDEVRDRIERMVALCPSGAIETASGPDEPGDEPSFEPGVAVIRDGPLWVRGGVRVIGADGKPYEVRNRVTLCRCGRSGNKPFCDGTHKEVGFRDG